MLSLLLSLFPHMHWLLHPRQQFHYWHLVCVEFQNARTVDAYFPRARWYDYYTVSFLNVCIAWQTVAYKVFVSDGSHSTALENMCGWLSCTSRIFPVASVFSSSSGVRPESWSGKPLSQCLAHCMFFTCGFYLSVCPYYPLQWLVILQIMP